MGCNIIAQSNGEQRVCLECSVAERDGCEVVEGEGGKGLASGDYLLSSENTNPQSVIQLPWGQIGFWSKNFPDFR